jgi:hypothetical protein
LFRGADSSCSVDSLLDFPFTLFRAGTGTTFFCCFLFPAGFLLLPFFCFCQTGFFYTEEVGVRNRETILHRMSR